MLHSSTHLRFPHKESGAQDDRLLLMQKLGFVGTGAHKFLRSKEVQSLLVFSDIRDNVSDVQFAGGWCSSSKLYTSLPKLDGRVPNFAQKFVLSMAMVITIVGASDG